MFFLYHISGGKAPSKKIFGCKSQLGISEYQGLYLGYIEDVNEIFKINDIFISFVSEDVAEGFRFIGYDGQSEIIDEITGETTPVPQDKINEAKLFIKKLKVTNSIDATIDNTPGLLADLCKRVDILQRLVMDILTDSVPQSSVEYANQYKNNPPENCSVLAENQNGMTREELMTYLDAKVVKIASKLKDEYYAA